MFKILKYVLLPLEIHCIITISKLKNVTTDTVYVSIQKFTIVLHPLKIHWIFTIKKLNNVNHINTKSMTVHNF